MRAVGVALCLFVTGETVIERPGQLHVHHEERKVKKVVMTGVDDEPGRVYIEVFRKVGGPPVEG